MFSDDTIVQDCEPIFEESFDEEYLNQVKSKVRYVVPLERPYYTKYERSCRVLENGIPAIKLNFSND